MAHFPKPFYRKPLKKWYVQIKGKQHPLGDEAEPKLDKANKPIPPKDVVDRYHKLMAAKDELPEVKSVRSEFVIAIFEQFLEWTQIHQAKKTYEWHRDNLQVLSEALPRNLKVADLKPYHVTRVMDAQTGWANNTKNGFARSAQRAMKWAEKQGIIDRTPIPHVEKPAREAREDVITPEEFEVLLSWFPDQDFRDVLITAWETGCRPPELMKVEARHVDLANNRWVFPVKQSKGKKQPRIVYLSDRAAEITRRLVVQHPTGKLFRNSDGEPWKKNAINCRFHRKHKRFGKKYCLYTFRHSFATRMLLSGVDAIIVSMWLGHRDVSTLAKTYQHLQHRPEFLHDKLRQANSTNANASASPVS